MPEIKQTPGQPAILCDVRNGRILAAQQGDQKAGELERGCSRVAVAISDGTETDLSTQRVPFEYKPGKFVNEDVALARPAVPYLYTCSHHKNWPHSEDAAAFADTTEYRQRKTRMTASKGNGNK